MSEKIKLDVDWNALFPSSDVPIGNIQVPIKPMNLGQLAIVINQVKNMGALLVEAGLDWENYQTPEGLVALSSILLTHAPESISEATNIELDDVKRLPLPEGVALLTKVLEVNLEAKGSLEKNFDSLTKNIDALAGQEPEKAQEQV